MKGIIVDIRHNNAAMLSKDGTVIKIPNNNYIIGQEVDIMKKLVINKKWMMAGSFAAVLVFAVSIYAYAYFTPYSYVSLDVNPSIEYELNRFDKVLSVKGVNEDGENILKNIDKDLLKHEDIDDALNNTIDEIDKEGYLDKENATLYIATASEDEEKADELSETLLDSAKNELKDNGNSAFALSEAVGYQRVQEARDLGVTPGKLNLVEKLKESAENPDDIDVSEWLDKPVKDILSKTNEYKEMNKEEEKNKGDETKNKETNTNEESNGSTKKGNEDVTKPTNKGNDKGSKPTDNDSDEDFTSSTNGNEGETTPTFNGSEEETTPSTNGNEGEVTSNPATINGSEDNTKPTTKGNEGLTKPTNKGNTDTKKGNN